MTTPAEPPVPSSTAASRPVAGTAAPGPRQASNGLLLLSIVGVGMIVGAIMVVVLKSSAADAGAPARAVVAPVAPVENVAAETVTTAVTPRWSGSVRRINGRNVAVYELEADNDVAVWGKVVRPVLTVRCLAGTTEVFVLTQSAAAMDQNDGKHAVRIGYDADPDSNERWLASDEYDALFAENGVAAARHIAKARRMRFGFTPYNGTYSVAKFQVAGFNALAPKLAKTCRWK